MRQKVNGKKVKEAQGVPYKEKVEDLKAMILDEEDYQRTISHIKLDDEQLMIFKRARLHLRKKSPEPLVIKAAYDIIIAKSFNNSGGTSMDDQGILVNKEENKLTFKEYFLAKLPFIIIVGGAFYFFILK